jgi:hypothetical protein
VNGLKTAILAAVCGALLVAAPAMAKNHDGEPPQAEGHANGNGNGNGNGKAKDDAAKKPVKTDDATAPVAVSGCPDRAFSKVFKAYRDRALYTLAGDFEDDAAGWELSDGASVAEESSSILLGDALGTKSLALADGASAVSPAICVAKGFPSFRFVARGEGAVRVDVLYANGKAKKAGRVKGGDAWHVSRKVSLAQGRFRVKRGQTANVQLRFTAVRGAVNVDDVYVDPRFRR